MILIRFVDRRLLLSILVLACAATIFFARPASADCTGHTGFSGGGIGSDEDPYVILTACDLDEVREFANAGAYFKLGADIDLSGFAAGGGWLPIGERGSSSSFTGTFDGGGHTISHLTISSSAGQVGLFGYVQDAEIRSIGLVNVNIAATGASSAAGGLAGTVVSSTIRSAYVTGNVSGVDKAGGLAGSVYGSSTSESGIYDSYSAALVTGSGNLGGLIGDIPGNASVYDSVWDFQRTFESAGGGTRLSTADMMYADNFPGGWFDPASGEWAIVEGVSYPMHRATFDKVVLDGLTIETQGGEAAAMSPVFDSGRLATYAVRVPSDVERVTVTATPRGAGSAVTIGGVAGASQEIDVSLGANAIEIAVSTEGIQVPGISYGDPADPTAFVYKLNVNREEGNVYPHSISTADQLASIGMGYYGLDHAYSLLDDIDLTGYDWEPIGDGGAPFSGTFDGGRHVIRSLAVDTDLDDAGLFGVSSGTIRFLGLENVNVAGGDRVGALVGTNRGMLSNVYAKGAVSGGDGVGGLVGLNDSGGAVTHAYAAGTVVGAAHVGGLAGFGSSGAVTYAYWDAEASGLGDSGGGAGMTSAQMRTRATYDDAAIAGDWDFSAVWTMIEGSTYPMWKERFDLVKLTALEVEPPAGHAVWPASFSPGQGAYTVELDAYVEKVEIAATAGNPDAAVTIAGATGASVPVKPGGNEIAIDIADAGGFARGAYLLNVQVPAPQLTDVALPPDGYYGVGDVLTFTITYEGEVNVVGEFPTLPLTIGSGTIVHAGYVGQPDGEPNRLLFEYEVAAGLEDNDGIELNGEIQLPAGVFLTAFGEGVPLVFTTPAVSGIKIDAVAPTIGLTQTPAAGTPTEGSVTVTAAVHDTGIGVGVVKWSAGARTAAFFADGGTALSGDSFAATANGTYTVYAKDAAGNEATASIAIANIAPAPGPSGGSLGGTDDADEDEPCMDGSCLYLRAGEAAEFRVGGMTIVIPAGATDEDMELKIEERDMANVPEPIGGAEIVSSVYELLKSSGKLFLKPVTLRIAFRPEDTAGRSASVFYFDEEAQRWTDVGGADVKGETIVVQVDHFTLFAALALPDPTPEASFTDIGRHWARERIEEAVRRGIVHGYPDGTFRPDEIVTRAEFAAMLANGFGWAVPDGQAFYYRDAADIPAWSLGAMKAAVGLGILQGYPDETVRPNAVIIRTEMATMLVRTVRLPVEPEARAAFRDADAIPAWAAPVVAAAARSGLVQGDERQQFNPAAGTTRAEAVVVIMRAFDEAAD